MVKKISKKQMIMHSLFKKATNVAWTEGKKISTEEKQYFISGITALEWSLGTCLFEFDYSNVTDGEHRTVEKSVSLTDREMDKINEFIESQKRR